jgi:hypothetical protein
MKGHHPAMSQRNSGYTRRPDDDYPTPDWVVAAIAGYLRQRVLRDVWEPAAGQGALAAALAALGFRTRATADDFLRYAGPPGRVDAIVSNPPYGPAGRLAAAFVRKALTFDVRLVAMLLRIDFDSGKTRADLFRDNPRFAGKLVLLDRIKWFEGPAGPSDNHAWFVWDLRHQGRPWIAYAGRVPPPRVGQAGSRARRQRALSPRDRSELGRSRR